MWGSWQPSFSYPNRSSSPVQLHAVALVESARNLTPQSNSRISQFIIVYHRIFHRGNHVTATNRREAVPPQCTSGGSERRTLWPPTICDDPWMVHGIFSYKISHWATPAATSDWWIFCSQSCACLSSLSPWTACQGWVWKKYTFQSEDLWVKYDYCVVSESPQNSATVIGLLLQKPHIAASELWCWGAHLFPPSMCWVGCSLMFLQSQSR